MTGPISLSAFADLARRRGNTAYAPPLEPPPATRAVRHPPDAPRQPVALSATFLKLRNRTARTNHTPRPVDLAACASHNPSVREPLPEKARSGDPGPIHAPAPSSRHAAAPGPASTAHPGLARPDPERAIWVPDQLGLARRCSAEIQLLTYRCAIGRLTDPQQVRFTMCAGWKQKQWKTRLIRLPFITETEDLVTSLKEKCKHPPSAVDVPY